MTPWEKATNYTNNLLCIIHFTFCYSFFSPHSLKPKEHQNGIQVLIFFHFFNLFARKHPTPYYCQNWLLFLTKKPSDRIETNNTLFREQNIEVLKCGNSFYFIPIATFFEITKFSQKIHNLSIVIAIWKTPSFSTKFSCHLRFLFFPIVAQLAKLLYVRWELLQVKLYVSLYC